MTFTASSNADTLAAALSRVGVQLAELEPVNTAAGARVLGAAHPPQRTGALAASLRSAVGATEVTWTSPLSYATFVHWGAPRHHQRAQPFLLNALELSTAEVAELYARHVRDTIHDHL